LALMDYMYVSSSKSCAYSSALIGGLQTDVRSEIMESCQELCCAAP
jgi:hypothetical protein